MQRGRVEGKDEGQGGLRGGGRSESDSYSGGGARLEGAPVCDNPTN